MFVTSTSKYGYINQNDSNVTAKVIDFSNNTITWEFQIPNDADLDLRQLKYISFRAYCVNAFDTAGSYAYVNQKWNYLGSYPLFKTTIDKDLPPIEPTAQ